MLKMIGRLRQPRILVVGDLMLDRYIWGNAERISPEAAIPVLRADQREERLGGAAGVAAILHVLDARVSLAGVLGADRAGTRCRELLADRGIDTAMVMTDVARPTTLKERYIGRADQKHPQQMLRVDYESQEPAAAPLLGRMTADLRQRLPEHDIILVSDYGKGVCSAELLQALIRECRGRGLRIVVDPGQKTPDLPALSGCNSHESFSWSEQHYAQPPRSRPCHRSEAKRPRDGLRGGGQTARATGIGSLPHHTRPRRHGLGRWPGKISFPHAGAARLRHYRGRRRGLGGARPGLASGLSYPEAIALANVAAGLSVERIGVTVVTRQEILGDLLRHRPPGQGKLVGSREALAEEMNLLRGAGRSIVFTNGCFDLLHSGHVHLLQERASRRPAGSRLEFRRQHAG